MITGSTLETIYNNIVTEIDTMSNLAELTPINSYQNLLSQLNTESQVGVNSLLTYTVAYNEWMTEQNIINFYNEINSLLSRVGYGQSQWLIDRILEFQLGDELLINTSTYELYYETVDTSKQIILSCSVEEVVPGILIKVRRKDTDVLTTIELEQLKAYISKIKVMGQVTSTLSYEGDKLKLIGKIIYNAQLNMSTVKSEVESAINGYIAGLPFNSTFITSKLIDTVMSVNGVRDFQITTLQAKDYIKSYSNVVNQYITTSGYLTIDPSFTLSDNLTYTSLK